MSRLTPEASVSTRRRKEALKFAVYYAVFGVAWVLGTDLLAEWIAQDEPGLRRLSTMKGWLFVLLSTGLVYFLALKSARSHERSMQTTKDAEHRFRGLMEQAPDMVFWVAESGYGRVHYVSSTIERLWGCAPERVYEDPDVLLEFVHPEDHERFLTERRAVRDGTSFDREYRIVRPDGEVRWMRSQGYPIYDERGGVEGVAGLVQDITRRKAAFEELRRSEVMHRRAQRIGGIGHWELDAETRELTWSDEVYRIFGLERGAFVPTPESFRDRVHPDDRAAQAAADEAALAGVGALDIEHRIIRPGGEVRHVHGRATLVEEDGTQRLVGTVQDVTERRRLQMEVEASRDLLRRYLANKIGERERERIVLAREIHDHIGQLLTVVKLQLGRELRHAAGERHERQVETIAVVVSAIEEMRNISARLRPPALDQLGLVDALEDYVAEFSEDSGLSASFSSDVRQVTFNGEAAGHLFRIVQEALTNVIRHARADRARVELRSEADAVVLRILDDGVGLPSRSPDQADRLGILGMQERAVLLGGRFELIDREPSGLAVCVRVPYDVLDVSGRQG